MNSQPIVRIVVSSPSSSCDLASVPDNSSLLGHCPQEVQCLVCETLYSPEITERQTCPQCGSRPTVVNVQGATTKADKTPIDVCSLPWEDVLAWPYPTIETEHEQGNRALFEITQATYYQQLDALPPRIHTRYAFIGGSALKHDEKGHPVYTGFYQIGDRFFCRLETLSEFSPSKAYREVTLRIAFARDEARRRESAS